MSVLVTLTVWYVLAWLTLVTAFTRGYIPPAYERPFAVPFKPLIEYANSNQWGAEFLKRFYCHANRVTLSAIVHLPPAASEGEANSFFRIGELGPNISMALYRRILEEDAGRTDEVRP
ncbi:MAG: hypothetical protein U0992_21985 [Planctomycetaceae bacterium]